MGGKTSNNIIFNLGYLGQNTIMYGCCGNDILGDICIKSFEEMKVDTNYIKRIGNETRRFYIDIEDKTTRKRCPICNEKTWSDNKYDLSELKRIINDEDIIIFDELNNDIISFYADIPNKIMIDIGYYKNFEKLSDAELLDYFTKSTEIINMNERVEKYLIKRFSLKDSLALYHILQVKLLIITRGSLGADFIFNDMNYHKRIDKATEEVDTNGCGDMFYASIINDYINNAFRLDKDFIDRSFKKSINYTSKVVSNIGSRSYAHPLYKKIDKICDKALVKTKNNML